MIPQEQQHIEATVVKVAVNQYIGPSTAYIESGEWAAYFGPADWTDEQVARMGKKLSEHSARRIFPNVAGPYRP